jgi:hypothetical protein
MKHKETDFDCVKNVELHEWFGICLDFLWFKLTVKKPIEQFCFQPYINTINWYKCYQLYRNPVA